MNVGLSNLSTLKEMLLPQSMRAQTQWDTILQRIGLGVLGLMEAYCDRKFQRIINAQMYCQGGKSELWLNRLPIESISSIELRAFGPSDWQAQENIIAQQNDQTGLVLLTQVLGGENDLIRVTYTGGYWVDDTEDSSGTLPSGATAAPHDLVWAWATQCEHVWSRRDKLGAGLVQQPGKASALGDAELLPIVTEALQPYRRLASR
jgi:hypothetical protein